MNLTLIDPENSIWRNALGILAAIVVVPFVMVAQLITLPFQRPVKRSADEVVQYLRGFMDGTGGKWDFDDFTSCSIADPRLESIRDRVAQLDLPISGEGIRELGALFAEAEALAGADQRDL